tara:strand:+ start:411 stop:1799 length:1389 start_codon:yes stop_codon:yes gene_type:complete
MKENIRINLTPGYVNKLVSKVERYFVADSECPGLSLKIEPVRKDKKGKEHQGRKTWVWNYRPKGKNPTHITLGRLEHLSPDKARRKVKSLQGKHVSGKDPVEEKNKWKSEISLSDGLEEYFDNHLTRSKGFRVKTIKEIKGTFNIWIFRNTKDLNVKRRYPVEELKNKKLSAITPAMIKVYHEAIGSKAPYMANRFVAYLKMFFNYAIDREWCEENPCAKFKGLYEEKPYQDSLTKTERNRIYDIAVVRDERSGRLLKSHYEQNELNPVSCCLIAFQLFTGRRTRSEASLLKWSMIRRASKKIILERTKTSKKNKIFSFKLGPRALEILQTIQTDRLNNPESRFSYPSNDVRSKYVFPSTVYGRVNKFKKVITTPYVIDPRVTWTKLLKMAGIDRHMKHYATRHTHLSIALATTQNIKTVSAIGGVTEQTALGYAKQQEKEIQEALEKMDEVEPVVPLREVK